jgi:acyl-CoA synthetase (AMP-forming)/AMP-acid ligase II
MTEALPTTSISLPQISDAMAVRSAVAAGVCVGLPVTDTEVQIAPLDHHGRASESLSNEPGIVGEIVIRAPHMRDGYDRLWHTELLTSQPTGWHRSGDVGQLDEQGRLWVGGRIGHVITTPTGPVTPVGIEQEIEEIERVALAAVVGVGPVGTQQLVVVVELNSPDRKPQLADLALLDQCRVASGQAGCPDVAAVLLVPELPVDRRHNSKVDRTRVASWAAKVLAGGKLVSP